MARIRSIKPEFPQSESMGRVGREARLLFVLLWTIADDEGRGRGNSRMLASLLYPYDADAGTLMDGWMAELEREGCIVRWVAADGATYFACPNWAKHQRIDKPTKSKIVAPPTGRLRDAAKIVREASANVREPSWEEGKGREGIGGEGNSEPKGSAADAASAPKIQKPPSKDDRTWLFNEAMDWLVTASGKTERQLRSVIGKWLSDLADDETKLRPIFEAAIAQKPAEPIAWITAGVAKRKAGPSLAESEAAEWRMMLTAWCRAGVWDGSRGRPPDHPKNQIPAAIMAEFSEQIAARIEKTGPRA